LTVMTASRGSITLPGCAAAFKRLGRTTRVGNGGEAMVNDIDPAEVFRDLINWLDGTLSLR